MTSIARDDSTTRAASSPSEPPLPLPLPPQRFRDGAITPFWSRMVLGSMLVAVMVMLVARALGPIDFSDQDQPKTTSYTTNIVLHPERWALPRQGEWYTATKPPLYNWVAAPFVMLTEGRSILAHKAPSILSFLGLAVLAWMVGSRLDVLAGRSGVAPEFAPAAPATADPPASLRGRLRAAVSGSGMLPITGSLTVLIFSCNYTWYKQAMLARPDAILSLCLMIAWVAATVALSRAAGAAAAGAATTTTHGPASLGSPSAGTSPQGWQILTWVSAGFAGLAKGPPALLIPLYVVLLGIIIGAAADRHPAGAGIAGRRLPRTFGDLLRRVRWALRASGFVWGLPLMIAIVGLWIALAFAGDPEHTYRVLIKDEFLERITGTGTQGAKNGPADFLRTLPYMPLYFISRFLPWSVLYIVALVDLARRPAPGRFRGLSPRPLATADRADDAGETPATTGPATSAFVELRTWIVAAAVYPLLSIVFFSLSTGKRPDYVAAAYFPAALLVAWWFSYLGLRIGRRMRIGVIVVALGTLTGVVTHEAFFGFGVRYPLGTRIVEFTEAARDEIAAHGPDRPLEFYGARRSTMQTLMHRSQIDLLYVEDPTRGDGRTVDVRLASIASSGLPGVDLSPEASASGSAAGAGGREAVLAIMRGHAPRFWLIVRVDDYERLVAESPEFASWKRDLRLRTAPAFGDPGAGQPHEFALILVDPLP